MTFIGLAFFAPAAVAAPKFPELIGRVVDQADLLSAGDVAELTAKLEALEAKSSDQLVVVTIPSLQGYPIEDFGYQLGRTWALGQKKANNGLLLIVAPNERKVRIEVGYGTEGIMPDALASNIITGTILPHFRRGDFAGGIKDGVNEINDALLADPAEVAARAAKRNAPVTDITPFVIMAIWIAIVIFMIWRSRQEALKAPVGPGGKRRSAWPNVVIVPSGGWGSSGGWSSGGGGWSSGGGSSGGWSGGGGGSFGGGGASGSW